MDWLQILIGFLQAAIMAAGAFFTWRAATSWREERRHVVTAEVGNRILSELHLCCSAISDARSPMQFHDIQYGAEIAKLITPQTETAARSIYYPAGYLHAKSSRFDQLEGTLGPAELHFSAELAQKIRELIALRSQVTNSSEYLTKRLLEPQRENIDTDISEHEAFAVFSGKSDPIQRQIEDTKTTAERIIREKTLL